MKLKRAVEKKEKLENFWVGKFENETNEVGKVEPKLEYF